MPDAIAARSGANEWGALIEETRLALSTLRAQDLDELTARAHCMLAATVGQDSIRQRMPWPRQRELLEMTRQRRLLSDLLIATGKNLDVLRRMRGHDCVRPGEANARWVR